MVHIVEDQDAIRRSTGFLLEMLGYGVATYASGIAFLDQVHDAWPGCILLDMRMPVMGGLEVQRRLIEQGVTMPLVMFSANGDVHSCIKAMRAGAIDFIAKPFGKAILINAITAAFEQFDGNGDRATRAANAAILLKRLGGDEQLVLARLVQGLSNRETADALGISLVRVEVQRAELLAKLGVTTLAQALRIVFSADPVTGAVTGPAPDAMTEPPVPRLPKPGRAPRRRAAKRLPPGFL